MIKWIKYIRQCMRPIPQFLIRQHKKITSTQHLEVTEVYVCMIGNYSINVRVKVQWASGYDIVTDKYLVRILDQLAVSLNPSFKDNEPDNQTVGKQAETVVKEPVNRTLGVTGALPQNCCEISKSTESGIPPWKLAVLVCRIHLLLVSKQKL